MVGISPSLFPVVKLLRAGRMGYIPALRLQHLVQNSVMKMETPGSFGGPSTGPTHTLILVEHDPVYTLGLREKVNPEERDRLMATGAQVVHADRGGLTTFHGPGQLVAYPIIHLGKWGRRSLPLRTYVEQLEMVAVHTCRVMGVPAVPSAADVSHTGAWARDNKICAIGVHCKRFVTTHGLALNCNVDLNYFNHIVPCGIEDKGVTSLSRELDEEVNLQRAEAPLLTTFQNVFSCGMQEMGEVEAAELISKANGSYVINLQSQNPKI